MKILLSPYFRDEKGHETIYELRDDVIKATVKYEGKVYSDTFDFSYFANGVLELVDQETGKENIETELPINPIISAKRENGELWVELWNWIDPDASEDERFPEWRDHKDIIAQWEAEAKEKEVNELKSKFEGSEQEDNSGLVGYSSPEKGSDF